MNQMRIVSHNVFWFQGHPFATDRPGAADAHILDSLCALYRSLSPAVLCLQEIQDQATFLAVQARLEMDGAYCPGGHLPQYGGAVFWRTDGRCIADSRTAGSPIQRMWQLVEARAGDLRIRVCNVHLPSNRQLGPEASGPRRVEDLRSAIETTSGPPDILAGDLNELPGGPVGQYAAACGYADAAVLTRREALPTNLAGSRGDWILIRRDLAHALTDYHAVPAADVELERESKTHLSDHLPLWVTLRTRMGHENGDTTHQGATTSR